MHSKHYVFDDTRGTIDNPAESVPTGYRNLTDEIRKESLTMEFANCPECNLQTVVRLPDDWQTQATVIPIVGCGNPWHYATRSLGDDPSYG